MRATNEEGLMPGTISRYYPPTDGPGTGRFARLHGNRETLLEPVDSESSGQVDFRCPTGSEPAVDAATPAPPHPDHIVGPAPAPMKGWPDGTRPRP